MMPKLQVVGCYSIGTIKKELKQEKKSLDNKVFFSEELTIKGQKIVQLKVDVKKLEQKLQTMEKTHSSLKILEMSKKPNVNEVSIAHLDPNEPEVELRAVKNYFEEPQDFSIELK
ncbi:hypothetical protein TNCV_4710741 [Trichonephila clavipes]|uniref:Uncharacterized protein n=1 Tax=Trichonephila clavipes TaxID=2585209 RepID=A0A8X6RR77_TRICX|nr:hypothetical protein TNCV_4710741 [Trichonephila clavipes]